MSDAFKIKIKEEIDYLIKKSVKLMQKTSNEQSKIKRLQKKQEKREEKRKRIWNRVQKLTEIYNADDSVAMFNAERASILKQIVNE